MTDRLLKEIRECRACEPHLPFAPRPVLVFSRSARILIVGQAPGTRVQNTGIPWNDPSGDRLRTWMGISRETFYDSEQIAIVPMGFCYPGKGKSGDLPPRKECALLWREKIHRHLPDIRLTLLVGGYAQAHYLQNRRKETLTDTVRAFEEYLPEYFPLVHPSPRNYMWLKKNPWFETQTIPVLEHKIHAFLAGG